MAARSLASLGPALFQGLRAQVFAWDDGLVVKLYLAGRSRRAVDSEAYATRRVHEAGLPAPACYGTVEIAGRFGIILQRIDGPSMAQALLSSGWTRSAELGHTLGELHAKMHSVFTDEADPLGPAIRHCIERAPGLPPEMKEAVLRVLAALPDGQGDSLLHGDFHPMNVLMSGNGPVVIDWDNVHRGNPLADVGRTLLLLRSAGRHAAELIPGAEPAQAERGVDAFVDAYVGGYFGSRPGRKADAEAWLVPLATARLIERVPGEEEWLTGIIADGLAKSQPERPLALSCS